MFTLNLGNLLSDVENVYFCKSSNTFETFYKSKHFWIERKKKSGNCFMQHKFKKKINTLSLILLQQGESMADVRTPPGSSQSDNIRTVFGASIAR